MTENKMGWLDKLPALVRHILIAGIAVFAGVIVKAIIVAQGVTAVLWHATFVTAVDSTAVSMATIALALWITPLTRQYGPKFRIK